MNIQHSARTDAWRTPPEILKMVKVVLGPIDFDAASDNDANRDVQAGAYFDEETDALTTAWPVDCSVYLNPPGGKLEGKSKVRLFWQRLMKYRKEGHLKHAIFACFSVEALQTTQGDHPCAMDFPFCVPKKRVKWVHPVHRDKISPSHSNAFIYVPGTVNSTSNFIIGFSPLGKCVHPR